MDEVGFCWGVWGRFCSRVSGYGRLRIEADSDKDLMEIRGVAECDLESMRQQITMGS